MFPFPPGNCRILWAGVWFSFVFSLTASAQECLEERVLLSGGSFLMGVEPSDFRDSLPVHPIELDSFHISRFETTVRDYLNYNPNPDLPDAQLSKLRDDLQNRPCLPIQYVTWQEARDYCNSRGGRLPREGEWEYAASARVIQDDNQPRWPLEGDFPKIYESPVFMTLKNEENESSDDDEKTEDDTDSGESSEGEDDDFKSLMALDLDEENTGTPSHALYRDLVTVHDTYLGANGLYGISGSVWEWVSDWYSPYQPGKQINPEGPLKGFWKVLRGGSHQNLPENSSAKPPQLLSTRFRNFARPDQRKAHVGFRCAWEVEKFLR